MNRLYAIAPIIALLFAPFVAQGGFGITPPYVQSDTLIRTSQYDQTIILVRSDPTEDLEARISVNVPEAGSWITIDKGLAFPLPKGERQVPMTVHVSVPDDAEFGTYRGNIRVVIASPSGPQAGTVGIALGAQIDVALAVIDKKIFDFRVRAVTVFDLNEGHKLWWMYFPGKVRLSMNIENLGNVPAAPTKVEFDIYDSRREKLLESLVNTNEIVPIEPSGVREGATVAEFPTKLPAGTYQAVYRIYKNTELLREGDVTLTIVPYGTLAGYAGYGFEGLDLRDQLIVIILVLVPLIGLIYSTFVIARHRRRKPGTR
jgi:hypothetical protein